MTQNAAIDDVIQIIDIMLTIANQSILEMVRDAPSGLIQKNLGKLSP